MGEFGFITGDGVYHVTGYGTDENGNFKILYMKNIKIGLPGEPGQQPAPKNLGGGLPEPSFPRETPPPSPSAPSPSEGPKAPKASDVASCGSCKIPEIEKGVSAASKTQSSPNANSIAQAPRTSSAGSGIGGSTSGRGPGNSVPSSAAGSKGVQGRQGKALGFENPNAPQNNGGDQSVDSRISSSQNGSPKSPSGSLSPSGGSSSGLPGQAGLGSGSGSGLGSGSPSLSGGVGSSDPSGISIASNKPGGVAPIGGSGSPSKIPLDLSKMQDIINGILYKFNYTAGYHGHHEQGDHIGNKDGGYFSVSRDGYHRAVDYTANENGFQPYIKLRQAADNEVPKPETEKEAGLKGYEFKWFNLGEGKKQ
ncbi:protein lethal(3)malignant blood neoplasm 1-like isoform X2 [Condylostylus longicornis]|nr:protein lethal(3)malignant blood neoplasm 1-like isoform X2 [Condylostylus longicornis]